MIVTWKKKRRREERGHGGDATVQVSDLGRSTPMALRDRCAVFAVYVYTEIIIATIHLRTYMYRRITCWHTLAHQKKKPKTTTQVG